MFIPKVLIHIYVNNTVSLNEKLSCCLSLYLIKVGRTSSSVTTDASSDLEALACVRCHGKLLVHKGKHALPPQHRLHHYCGVADQCTL